MEGLAMALAPHPTALHSLASYARAVRPHLPDVVFAPNRARLAWLPVHVAVITALAAALATGWLPAALWPAASLGLGLTLAASAFLGHEILHGAIVRGRRTIHVLGGLCLLPFTLSPTLWVHWHNRVHHHGCAQVGRDPDMYPTLAEYEAQPFARLLADYFGLGGRRWRSVLSLLIGFTGQSQQMLWQARQLGLLTARQHRRALAETGLGVAAWATLGGALGGTVFVFVYVLPLVVANATVMAFILTNHSLSALTPGVNDPLVNSLTVTLPRPLAWLSLGFGYHVEHHVFPAISARHAPRVRRVLLALFPARYQALPLPEALRRLYRSGRVYRDDHTLIDPRTGTGPPALRPRDG